MPEINKSNFEYIYNEYIKNNILICFNKTSYNEIIISFIDKGTNHYHSGVLFLINKISDAVKYNNIIDLCCIAEYSWMSILTVDDVCDKEFIRRGEHALWVQKGEYFAFQSSLYCSYEIVEFILSNTNVFDFIHSYMICLKEVAKGQIQYSFLTLESTYSMFVQVGMSISSHLPCFINYLLQAKPDFQKANLKTWRYLQFASIIKNQFEDILAPNESYKIEANDIINKQVTFVIKYLTQTLVCEADRKKVESYFISKYSEGWEEVLRILRNNISGIKNLKTILFKIVDKSYAIFQKSLVFIEVTHDKIPYINSLNEWIQSYKYLGNPYIGVIDLNTI